MTLAKIRRQVMAQPPTGDIAARAAHLLMQAVFRFRSDCGPWRIHLSVITKNRKIKPTIRYDWQRMNMFGVSFEPRDVVEAEAWAVEVIRAGYRPFYHFRKGGSGSCPNEVNALLEAKD